MQLFLKILSGMANSVDPDQTAPCLIWVYTVCICHFVRNLRKQMGLTKAGDNSRKVVIWSARNSRILLYLQTVDTLSDASFCGA